MSGNVFGKAFQVMTFGESHGPYIGVVIDGIRPGLPVDVEEIQRELNRRRPGQSGVVTPRQESDRVEIISGVFQGKTTGTPLCMLIANRDQRSRDYREVAEVFRPGHAGFTFLKKYGVYDYRGGGRSSGRETASRVAAGALAKQFLRQRGVEIIGFTRRIGEVEIEEVDFTQIEKNPVRAPDAAAARRMIKVIEQVRQEGDSLGGVVEVVVKSLPAGLGEPVFHKLPADLAAALMSIGAVKGVEVGSGFAATRMKGSQHNDPFYFDAETNRVRPRTNRAGGVLGGISTGEDLVLRIAVKPPSSIRLPQETTDIHGNPVTLKMDGRHDPCICPRVVPVAEAMVALVLIDHLLLQERLQKQSSLQSLRQAIDTIDVQLVLLLTQRRELIQEIARIKRREKRRVLDASREEEVRQNWQELAESLGFPVETLQRIVEILLEESKTIQKGIVK